MFDTPRRPRPLRTTARPAPVTDEDRHELLHRRLHAEDPLARMIRERDALLLRHGAPWLRG